MTVVMCLTAALFVLAVLWKVYQLTQAPYDRALRAVTACLVCTAGSFSTGFPPEKRALDAALGTGAASLLSNVLLLAAVYSLLTFFLHSAADRHRASRRARLEAVPLVLTAIVITVATVTAPADVRGRPYGQADLHTPQVAVFFVAAQLYLVYSLATTARWTARYARMSQKPSATGLWITAGSLAGMAAANALRVVMDLTGWFGSGTAPAGLSHSVALLFALAVPAFVVGLSYPGLAMRLAGFRIWRQHRRTYQRLRPLWDLLHDAFPQDALGRSPGGRWREAIHVRGVHRRYYRRVIECRDGLVRVSPYLAQLGVQDGATPQAVAEHLRAALCAQAAGTPVTTEALAVALPGEDSIDADARQLVAVAEALVTTA
ncbi:MAB_1171c family putative transporter [Streptomyces sp. NPDC001262]|uniref:MAB_1171c family putative transporter n=1 Tax=unclassified Streptomyces TaxID=2593676 RepID=UPI0036B1789F